MVNIIKPEEPLEIVIRITKGKIISSIIVTLFLLYIIYKYLIKDKKQDLYETTHNERRFDAAKKEHEKIIQIKNIPSSVEINDNKVNGSIVQKLPKINDSLEKDKKELIKNNKENLHTQQQTHIIQNWNDNRGKIQNDEAYNKQTKDNVKIQIEKIDNFQLDIINLPKVINKSEEELKNDDANKYDKLSSKIRELSLNSKISNILIDMLLQMFSLKWLENGITKRITSENMILLKKKIQIQIYEMLKIMTFLNNIRLIILTRKYTNNIIKNQIENNEKIRISSSLFLTNIKGFKFKNDPKKLKIYLSKFIVQIGDDKLSQNAFNLTSDFLFFIKSFCHDNYHLLKPVKDITKSNNNHKIFSLDKSNFSIINDKNNVNNKENKKPNLKVNKEITFNIIKHFDDNIQSHYTIRSENIEFNKIEKILLIHDNIQKVGKEIDNLDKIDKDMMLEKKLINELKKEKYNLFNEEEKIIDNKKNSFSFHDLKDESINSFKNIFNDNEKYINYDDLLKDEKKIIEDKYSKIINILISSEIIIDEIRVKNIRKGNESIFEISKDIIYNIEVIKEKIGALKKWLIEIKEQYIEYYELLLLSTVLKIKVEQLEKQKKEDKNSLSFQELFSLWKENFSEKHIANLKKQNSIDEKEKYVYYDVYDKKSKRKVTKKIEYLKESPKYLEYIDRDELNKINYEDMLKNIDIITEGEDFSIHGLDEDIDHYRLVELNEE